MVVVHCKRDAVAEVFLVLDEGCIGTPGWEVSDGAPGRADGMEAYSHRWVLWPRVACQQSSHWAEQRCLLSGGPGEWQWPYFLLVRWRCCCSAVLQASLLWHTAGCSACYENGDDMDSAKKSWQALLLSFWCSDVVLSVPMDNRDSSMSFFLFFLPQYDLICEGCERLGMEEVYLSRFKCFELETLLYKL